MQLARVYDQDYEYMACYIEAPACCCGRRAYLIRRWFPYMTMVVA